MLIPPSSTPITPATPARPPPSLAAISKILHPIAFGSGTQQGGDLQGFVYFIPENTPSFPDVTTMNPSAAIFTKTLNVPQRTFTEGFPGVANRTAWFAIRYQGNFLAPATGDYTFRLVSDDGAILYIDDQKVIDNDGVHTVKEQQIPWMLTRGSHKIRVDYFQATDSVALQLWMTPPSGGEGLLTSE